MANLEVTPLMGADTFLPMSNTSGVRTEECALFNVAADTNEDKFISNNQKDDVKSKTYKNKAGRNVTDTYTNGKLTSRKLSESGSSWHGEVEWDTNGNVKVVDYHEPNEEYDYNAYSYRIEILPDGQYTLKHRDAKGRTWQTERGNIKDADSKDYKRTYIDEMVDFLSE